MSAVTPRRVISVVCQFLRTPSMSSAK